MNLETLLSGALGTLIGTVIGAFLSFRFQKALLRQQLDFQARQAELDATERKRVSDATIEAVTYLRDTLNYRIRKATEKIGDLARAANRKEEDPE